MYLTGGLIMTQTVQSCSWPSLSEADKDLPKAEEEILNLLLALYANMSKINKDLKKLDYIFTKILMDLNIHFEEIKQGE
jgi:hypothetical protein